MTMTNLLLAATNSWMRIDVLIWILAIPVVIVFIIFLFLQIRQHLALKNELIQLNKIKRHSIEYELVIKAMHLAIWRVDIPEGIIYYESDYRGKADSFKTGDGFRIADTFALIHSDQRERVRDALMGLIEGRYEDYHQQYQAQAAPDAPFYWEETFATVDKRDIDGKPLAVVGTSMRIDEQKEIERELIEARNRAEESDRLKSAFLANITHEVRTPLNAIVGFSDILPMAQSDEERNELVKLIKQNNAHLLRLFDDMVNMSKLESDNAGEIQQTNFEIVPLMRELVEKYQSVCAEKGLEVFVEEPDESETIHTDRDRLREILNQYMNNAVKFTSAGSISLGYEKQPSSIRLWVSDTGKGIPSDMCNDRLFERFVKVDDFIAGTGLGLSICRSLAESLGGQVGVESILGKGSTFWVSIPMNSF